MLTSSETLSIHPFLSLASDQKMRRSSCSAYLDVREEPSMSFSKHATLLISGGTQRVLGWKLLQCVASETFFLLEEADAFDVSFSPRVSE
jgi:hypothetical protein